MSSAPKGVVIFSFGVWLDDAFFPTSQVESLLEALSKLPQRVVLKLSNLPSTAKYANMMVLPYLPQQALLAHPSVVLFFSHCGSNGVMEAIYHAVPLVGMPMYLDQVDTCAKMRAKGLGEVLDKSASAEEIHRVIVKVRDEPRCDAIWLSETSS